MIEYIENLLIDEAPTASDPSVASAWVQQVKDAGKITAYVKKGGSPYDASAPFIRSESVFKKQFDLNKLIKAIYAPDHVRKWDKSLLDSQVEPLRGESKSCFYSYTCYKGSLGFDSRDFYEKAMAFEHNGKYYRYSAFVPNSSELGPNGEPIRKN